jgi:molecular chaperone GrpE
LREDDRSEQPWPEAQRDSEVVQELSGLSEEAPVHKVSDVGEQAEAEPTVEERLQQAEAKAAEYLDGWQRAQAEFANARKRLEKQRAEVHQNAAVDHAAKLLPIFDDFDRALESVPDTVSQDPWFGGITLVRRKLQNILVELNVEPIEAMGQPFDPNYHEALALVETDGYEHGTVIEELQTGYRLGERVIRPALVNVAA